MMRAASLALAALLALSAASLAGAEARRYSLPLERAATGMRVCAAAPGAPGGYWTAAHCLDSGPMILEGDTMGAFSVDPQRDLAHIAVPGAVADEIASVVPGDVLELRSDRPVVLLRLAGAAWCERGERAGTWTYKPLPLPGTWRCAVLCHEGMRRVWAGDSGAGVYKGEGGALYGILFAADLGGVPFEDDYCGADQIALAVPVP